MAIQWKQLLLTPIPILSQCHQSEQENTQKKGRGNPSFCRSLERTSFDVSTYTFPTSLKEKMTYLTQQGEKTPRLSGPCKLELKYFNFLRKVDLQLTITLLFCLHFNTNPK